MKKVMVTGGSGFIGAPTLSQLANRGFEVIAVSRSAKTPVGNGVQWLNLDLMDQPSMIRAMREMKPNYLLHLAWDVRHGIYWNSPENLDWIAASLGLVRAFLETGGTRLLGVGTCAEYVWENKGPLQELQTPLVPATFYGRAKKSLFELLTGFSEAAKFSFAWARIFHVYGPGEDPRRLIRFAAESCLRNQPMKLSHGRQMRDFLHSEDVAGALVAILDSPVVGPVNVGSGEPQSLRSAIEILEEITGRRGLTEFGGVPTPPGDPDFLVSDNRRLVSECGWRPRFTLEEGLRRHVDWLKSVEKMKLD